jgi:hypothetical protein
MPSHKEASYDELSRDLYSFRKIAKYALSDIQCKADRLGIHFHSSITWQTLAPQPKSRQDPWPFSSQERIASIDHAVDLAFIENIVAQVGWLSWDEYRQLVYINCFSISPGIVWPLDELVSDPTRWRKEISFLYSLMETDNAKPFVPVLRKVIDRCAWLHDMRSKYPLAVQKRDRDFYAFGRTLNFTEKELQDYNGTD